MTMPPKAAQPASRSKPQRGDWNDLLRQLQSTVSDLQRLMPESIKEEPVTEARRRELAPPRTRDGEVGVQIQNWEDEPVLTAVGTGTPEAAQPITIDEPSNDQPLLKTHIAGPSPDPQSYDPTTPEFRYWNAQSALARGINFWGPLLPNGTQWSTTQQPMEIQLDEGVDFNAFYARESGLNFFHGEVDKENPHVTVFSGESPDVVCHELGHAILDAVKPELFDAMSIEVAAFHEAFGDMSSMLSALQLLSMRDYVRGQTGGQLNVNSRLSQLARQLGWAIRIQFDPTAVDSDCLRNTANQFFYQDPNGLPPSAPASQLSSEPHSFSRVFSGAFLDVLAAMFHIGPDGGSTNDSDKLEKISQDAGKLLIEGVRLAAVGSGFYSQVAAGMIQADQSLYNGRYRTALTSSFVQRGILAPAAAVALAQEVRAHNGQNFGVIGLVASNNTRQVKFENDNEGYKRTAKDAPALPLRPLVTRFGVTLHVHMPAEPNRFGVASAALTGGAERTSSPEEDARSFVEDLIQLDRISQENATGVLPAELTAPGRTSPCAKTHRVVKEDSKNVLKRHHFDCGWRGCKHGR
jgi:hypothetical protein